MADLEARLKVLQVASSLYDWGGIERYVVYLTEGLRAAGHHVVVAAPKRSPISERIGVAPISVRRKVDPAAISAYIRLIRSEKPDIIHCHFSPDFVSPAIAAKLAGSPVRVMSRHVALQWSRKKARLYAKLWHGIIPVSHAVERALLDSGIVQQRMIVAKAGTPALEPVASKIENRQSLGVPSDVLAFGTFGRLATEKGTDVFIRAISECPDAIGFVFGDGPEKMSLESLANKFPNVRIMGKVANVSDPMSAMDAVVIPSQWEEAFPYSALEAMSLGVPVIASRSGGMPEVVTPGQNGYLFERTSVSELSQLMRTADRSELSRLGSIGKDLHRAEYTVERMADRIAAAYQEFRTRLRESD